MRSFQGKGIVRGKGRTRKTVLSPYEKAKNANPTKAEKQFSTERKNPAERRTKLFNYPLKE